MAVSIDQQPLYNVLPIGQQVIFSVSDINTVATKFNVKFVAQVHVSDEPIVLANNNDLVATFKTTPNNVGVGIFDLRPILETFVSPDHEPHQTGISFPQYKVVNAGVALFPIHLVDKYSLNRNSMKYFAVNFYIEYSDSSTSDIINFADLPPAPSSSYAMFNGVIQYDDNLEISNNEYGYNLSYDPQFYPIPVADSKFQFLSNAPYTQYARLTDYGTVAFLNYLPSGSDAITTMTMTYYWADGSAHSETSDFITSNGGAPLTGTSASRLAYFGAFPANLQNWSSTFATAVSNGLTHYTVRAATNSGSPTETYTINILCPEIKGYEGIRLTWLNKWGVWDYYTFNMKSTRSVTTNRTPYTQLGGTWNKSTFKIAGYKGGKKNFRVNSTEKIRINTDFVTEAEGVWFEELINSTEVYILEGFQTDRSDSALNTYVQPTTVTNSSYTRKTRANDKLMQYTFEIEKSKMKRTQSV